MRTLEIDIECYSSNNLSKCGVYKYAEAPDFEILLFGYSVDNGPVSVVDLASGEKIPKDILKALTDENVIKIAHNANFERICLSRFLGMPTGAYLDPKSWQCSMVMCAYNGLPLSLKDAGAALNLDNQKMTEGTRLIRKFCVPNKTGCRNQIQDYPEDWEIFKSYNKRDVEVECAIINKLSSYPVPDFVWDEYHLDQEINDRGILIDMDVVRNAIKLDSVSHTELESQLKEITRLENPNSVAQMKKWLSDNGLDVDSLGKKQVTSLLPQTNGEIRKTLELRLQIAKSSVKKYQAMANTACSDNRVRGMFQFYGSRTGRWASRTINVQNLKQNHIEDLESAREVLKLGDYELMKMLYSDVPDTLSQLTRTAFIPRLGYKFIVSDFSSIEARVLSFLAGEQWRLDVFANNGDIYCESASRMFKVPVEKHGRNAHLRQKGKQAELACGYGGSVGALKNMGALELGLKEEELQPLVDMWRESNPHITAYWWKVDKAIRTVIKGGFPQRVGNIQFSAQNGVLFITLPSGRRLTYIKPRIEENQFGSESVTYCGSDAQKKLGRIESYGPKFVENIVQAISRDILAYAMKSLRDMRIVAHVHDELIIECPLDMPVQTICDIMGRTPSWISGLQLRADGYETMFYRKD